jgi:hypothetical protein
VCHELAIPSGLQARFWIVISQVEAHVEVLTINCTFSDAEVGKVSRDLGVTIGCSCFFHFFVLLISPEEWPVIQKVSSSSTLLFHFNVAKILDGREFYEVTLVWPTEIVHNREFSPIDSSVEYGSRLEWLDGRIRPLLHMRTCIARFDTVLFNTVFAFCLSGRIMTATTGSISTNGYTTMIYQKKTVSPSFISCPGGFQLLLTAPSSFHLGLRMWRWIFSSPSILWLNLAPIFTWTVQFWVQWRACDQPCGSLIHSVSLSNFCGEVLWNGFSFSWFWCLKLSDSRCNFKVSCRSAVRFRGVKTGILC